MAEKRSETFDCQVVTGDQIEDALDIRRRVYVEEFGFDLGSRVRDDIDDRALHLLATTGTGKPVGSLRLVSPTCRPFEIETYLPISDYLGPNRRPAEITRLCILAPYRRMKSDAVVHLAILRTVIRLTKQLDATDIIASTRSDLMAFYKYLLFSLHPGAHYQHPEIGNATHTLMSLDLAAAPRLYAQRRPTLFRLLRDVLS